MSEKLTKFNSNFFVACGEIYYFSDVAEFLITCNICKNENFENFQTFSDHLTECFNKFKVKTNLVLLDTARKKENKDPNIGLNNETISQQQSNCDDESPKSPPKMIDESKFHNNSDISFPTKSINSAIHEPKSLDANDITNQIDLNSLNAIINNCDKVPEELLEQVLSLEDETSQKPQITPSSINLLKTESISVETMLSSSSNCIEPDLIRKNIFSNLQSENEYSTSNVGILSDSVCQFVDLIPISDCKTNDSGIEMLTTNFDDTSCNTNTEVKILSEFILSNKQNVLDNTVLKEEDLEKKQNASNGENIKKGKRKKKSKTNEPKQPYKCKQCESVFKNVHSWLKHLRTVHNDSRPYCCDKCDKSFAQISRLKVHQRIHTGEKPYKCSYCERTFNQVSHKQRHERTHTGVKPFVCKICGKSFSQPESLKAHQETHLNPRPVKKLKVETKIDDDSGRIVYPCTKCDQTFPQVNCLQLHLQKFHAKRIFACNDCGKTFNHSSNLTVHKRLHAPDSGKHLKCSHCDRLFRQLGHLKRHEQTHTGIKPYKCHICEKKYVEMKDLRNHLQRHSDIRFECDLCPKWYKLESDLKRHKNRLHMNFENLK